jgi:DmsE family decaheme c-type cytochrome
MSNRRIALGGIALILLLTLGSGIAAQEAQQNATVSCGDCHDQAKAFVTNPHARGEVKDGVVPNSVCETCHGDGAAHIEGGGDVTKINVPRGLAGANETCLLCHSESTAHTSFRTGMHSNSNAVNCLSCHAIHAGQPRLLAKNEVAVCGSCHSTQAASFRNKPYAHRIGRGGMTCTSCHEPHGRPGQSMRLTKAGEIACLSCHSDKRGPYVFQHGGLALGDCTTCHEPHGSVNANQLKRTLVYQLCLECHSPITPGTAGSQPPAFHNLHNPRYQNCTSCHVAIHGSNRSPQLLK